MSIVGDLVADLAAAGDELDALVSSLDDAAWHTDTPAPGWTVAHQIAHLYWTDKVALLAATDPEAFAEVIAEAMRNIDGFTDVTAEEGAARPRAELLDDWRAARAALGQALVDVPDGAKIPWFGPPMSAASMATARMMETWAHGLDIADALGVELEPAGSIRHVAHIGVRTRDFAYSVNGMTPPQRPFRIELVAPSGELWTWGPDDPDAVDGTVRGPAVDFCQLVTQRRALEDLDLQLDGERAREWAAIAQCFAGPPGAGRAPRNAATF